MSNGIINYYEFFSSGLNWAAIRIAFPRNLSRFNIPYFESGSEVEQEFLCYCQERDLKWHRKTIVEYDIHSAESGEYLFLALNDDNSDCIPEPEPRFVDNSAACPGGGLFGSCGRGAAQSHNVMINPTSINKVTMFGMLQAKHPNAPRVILISSTIAHALDKAGATGIRVEPTNVPECHQLLITAETLGPAKMGTITMGRRCPVCGLAKMFFGNKERYFYPQDLASADFQICRRYVGDNVDQFEILNGFPIVSQRIFKILLALETKGLNRYCTDPPIQHAVVQILNP